MQHRRPRLEGKAAIVTGAGSSGSGVGVGKATSILFAREGASVLLVDHQPERAEETRATIQEEGGQASVFPGDVTRADDCRRMVEAVVERYARLDILVNNVGISGPGTATDVTEDQWNDVLAVNLKSMFLTAKYAIPGMLEAGGGSIVNISSIAAIRASQSSMLPYSASKGGVISLTISLAVWHGRDNIRVNCIAPGHLYTPMVAPEMDEWVQGVRAREMRILRQRAAPLGTEGTAWDVGWAAVFLASDEARWITGVVLPVDAGLVVTTPLSMWAHLR